MFKAGAIVAPEGEYPTYGTVATTDRNRSRQPGSTERERPSIGHPSIERAPCSTHDLRPGLDENRVDCKTIARHPRGFIFGGAGLIMLMVPGPEILVILLGLLVLAGEYTWVERALEHTRTTAIDATNIPHT